MVADGPSAASKGGEFALIARLKASLGRALPEGEVHIGDDAAVLSQPAGKVLFATDVAVEGVHFDLELGTAYDAGWKVLVANVSDIAAMGGVPTHAVVGLAAPKGTDFDGVLAGLAEAADAYGVVLVGGDLSSADKMYLSVAVLGDAGGLEPVLRSGARAGDELWCTGPLGASAAGLSLLQKGGAASDPLAVAFLHPLARPREGRLAAELGATAMIDVSDGLSQDLAHIAEASAVGFALDVVPVAAGATEEDALGGGEDYELVFAAPSGAAVEAAFVERGLRGPVLLGRCVAETKERTLRSEPLALTGWVHDLEAGPS